MIRLKLPTGELDLSPNTVVPWRTVNPFFEEEEEFSPQFSLPFTLPLTSNNQILLQYADQLQVSTYDKAFSCIMYYGGVLFFRGQLNILKAGSGGFQVSLSFDRSVMDTSRSLRSFSYGGPRANEADLSYRDVANSLFYPSTDFVWPMFKNLHPSKNAKFNGGNTAINFYNGATSASLNKELATPMPFLNYVTKQVFKEMGGIDATGSFFDQVTDKVIYNPVVANTMGDEKLKLYTDCNPAKHQFDLQFKEMEIGIDDANTFYNISVGAKVTCAIYRWPAGSSGGVIPYAFSYTIVLADLASPQTLLQNIWAAIQALSGLFVLREQQWADPVNPRFVIANAGRSIVSITELQKKRGIDYYPAGTYTYNDVEIAKHLPDITVRNYVNWVKDAFNLTVFFNPANNVITFTPRNSQISTHKYKDYTSKLITGHDKEVIETKDYRFVFENDTDDENTTDESLWYATNHAEHNSITHTDFSVKLATPKVESLQNPTTIGSLLMANVQQQMYKYDDVDVPKFTLRLLTWKGIVSDGFGNMAPQATSEGLTPNEMYDTWFKDWYRLTKNGRDLADFDIALDLTDLIKFDPELKWKVLHNNYIWKEIETNLTMQGIEPSRVRLLKLPAMANIYNTTDGEALPPE